MRKENSKYVERDGAITRCDSDLAAAIMGRVGGNYSPDDDCGISTIPTPYNTFNSCCNANPKAKNCLDACEECPDLVSSGQPSGTYCAGSGGGSTEDCSMGAKVSTSAGMVTCCDSGQSIAACASAEDISPDLATDLCGKFDDLSRACIAIPGGESARDRPDCVTQTIQVRGPDGMPGKLVKIEPDTYLNSSFNCNNAQNPELCAAEGALQYFKACRKGKTKPSPPSPPSPPSIRNDCKSDSDCDTGYSCHRNKCKQDQSSPVTGQGSNKGGMSGGEIAGIVVGSIAGAILLLLAVGALLRGSGKKGKKK